MAKYVNSSVLDGGLLAIKTGASRMLLLSNYTAGMSYSTVISNVVATVNMLTTDYSISGADNAPRILTTAMKAATATVAAPVGNDLHIAFTDGTSNVLWVTDEITNQAIIVGNTINFPAITYTAAQPT